MFSSREKDPLGGGAAFKKRRINELRRGATLQVHASRGPCRDGRTTVEIHKHTSTKRKF